MKCWVSDRQLGIGQAVDYAMEAIERDNPTLKGVLPKDYARPARASMLEMVVVAYGGDDKAWANSGARCRRQGPTGCHMLVTIPEHFCFEHEVEYARAYTPIFTPPLPNFPFGRVTPKRMPPNAAIP